MSIFSKINNKVKGISKDALIGITTGAGIAGGLLSNGYSNGIGNTMLNIGGVVSAIPGGLLYGAAILVAGGAVSGLFGSKKNSEHIALVLNKILDLQNFQTEASDYDLLASDWSLVSQLNFDKDYLGKEGLFSNSISKLYTKLNNELSLAYDLALNRLFNAADNILNNTMLNLGYNSAAYGGPLLYADGGGIHIKPSKRGTFTAAAKLRGLGVLEFASRVLANKEDYSSSMVKKANFARNASKWHDDGGYLLRDSFGNYSFGGWLNTHGSDFTNGLTEINTGGTHELNPNLGVMIGMDPLGKPNLVEEGEVVVNALDYVLSNRLEVPKKVLSMLGLKGKRGLTFALASKELSKEAEERPNDPISKRGLDDSINKLVMFLELYKLATLLLDTPNMFPLGGHYNYNNKSETGYTEEGLMNLDGTINFNVLYNPKSEFAIKRKYILDHWNNDDVKSFINNTYIPGINKYNKGRDGYEDLTTISKDDFEKYTNDEKWGAWHDLLMKNVVKVPKKENKIGLLPVDTRVKDLPSEIKKLELPEQKIQVIEKLLPNMTGTDKDKIVFPDHDEPLRYAPIYGGIGSTIATAFSPIDYSTSDAMLAAASRTGYSPIGYSRIGTRLKLTPMDLNAVLNPTILLFNANRRALLNTSALNPGVANANILANNNKLVGAFGDAYLETLKYDNALDLTLATFNRETELLNAGMGLDVNKSNLLSRIAAANALMLAILNALILRLAAKNAKESALSSGISGVLTSLGNLGKERDARFWRNWELASGLHELGAKEEEKKAKGGRIKRNKKGLTY